MTLLNNINVGATTFGMCTVMPMGTCPTPAGTEIKQVTFADDFSLANGVLVAVKFTYANTYGDGSTTYPKLQVDASTYPVVTRTGTGAASGAWANNETVLFLFDGTNFILL